MYSYRIEQAIRAASVLHKDHLRKGSMPLPYITHLVAVAFTLMDYTEDEDVIISALLHDTLEDTDYTLTELQEDFGDKVSVIVQTVTEPKVDQEGNEIPWAERKYVYKEQLRVGSKEALLVAAADKMHNTRTLIEDYADAYDRFIEDFGDNFDERLQAYDEVADLINSKLDSLIVDEFNYTHGQFKQFIAYAKKYQEQDHDTETV